LSRRKLKFEECPEPASGEVRIVKPGVTLFNPLNFRGELVNPCKTSLVVFMVVAACFCFGVSRAEEPSKVVAKVNDASITLQQVEAEVEKIISQTSYHRDASPEKRETLRKEAIEKLIEKELEYQEGQRQGIKVDSETIDERVGELKKRYPSGKAFKEALKKSNLTLTKLEEGIEREIVIERIVRAEVDEQAKVGEAEARDFYDKNTDKFREPERVKLRHIAVLFDSSKESEEKESARARAAEILKKIKAGGDFKSLASEYSEDSYKAKAGDLGYIPRGRTEPELEKTLFSVAVGETVGPVETPYGFYLLKVEDRKPEGLLPFDEVKGKISKELAARKKEERKAEWIKSLRAKAKIEYL
jgi:peptidyl-prolyl cis-trans isomerase C